MVKFVGLFGGLVDCLVGKQKRLVGWMVIVVFGLWFVCLLVGSLVCWWVGWMDGWLGDYFVGGWWVGWLSGWAVEGSSYLLTGWSVFGRWAC